MIAHPSITRPNAGDASGLFDELVVDNFAGGGGASMGIELATGRAVDIAINHDPEAIEMHRVNHPATVHLCESVWDVDPREVTAGRQVGLAWFSPDCTDHNKAKGGKPIRTTKRRGLAWVVLRWASKVRPRVIILENVEEFQQWGPLTAKRGRKNHPRRNPRRAGNSVSPPVVSAIVKANCASLCLEGAAA